MGPPPPPPAPVRRRVPRPTPVVRPSSPPPQQSLHPNGLHRYYHALRWGVPLPEGPLAENAGSDRELSEAWRLEEVDERIRERDNVTALQAELMGLWNAHIDALQPLVSQRALPKACRQFASEHASRLATQLREPFLCHLTILWEHNLLHHEDVQDCLVIIDSRAKEGGEGSGDGLLSSRRLAVDYCSACTRPLHEPHCALAGRVRGAAAGPAGGGSAREGRVLPGGPWEEHLP